MNRTLKIGLIATLIVYGCGMLYTYYSNIKFEERVTFFDKNQNGLIDNNEITKDSREIVTQMSKRKTTNQALIMLIPVSIILGLFCGGIAYLFRKIKSINDNEINYQNRR